MMPWWVLLIFVLGANFALWGTVGLVRLAESLAGRRTRLASTRLASTRLASTGKGETVMAVTADAGPASRTLSVSPGYSATDHARRRAHPAHNEALVPRKPAGHHGLAPGTTSTWRPTDPLTPRSIARRSGARVIETQENVGKAGALEEAIGRFDLISRFPVVMLLDADTRVEPGYFVAALPIFGNPQVVAVAGCVRTGQDRRMTLEGQVLVGHRTRIYAIGQRAGSARPGCASTPRPCARLASLYRTGSCRTSCEPAPAGDRDFNMTFRCPERAGRSASRHAWRSRRIRTTSAICA